VAFAAIISPDTRTQTLIPGGLLLQCLRFMKIIVYLSIKTNMSQSVDYDYNIKYVQTMSVMVLCIPQWANRQCWAAAMLVFSVGGGVNLCWRTVTLELIKGWRPLLSTFNTWQLWNLNHESKRWCKMFHGDGVKAMEAVSWNCKHRRLGFNDCVLLVHNSNTRIKLRQPNLEMHCLSYPVTPLK